MPSPAAEQRKSSPMTPLKDKAIRFGILGTARIARTIIRSINSTANAHVVAIGSRSKQRAAQMAKEMGIPSWHGDYSSVIARTDLDVIYIPLPNTEHYYWSKRALENQKHVLCEKPLVLTLKELDILTTLAKKNGLKLMEAMWYRFHPQTKVIKAYLNDRRFGRIQHFTSSLALQELSGKDIRWDPRLGGGALFDLMCYQIDAVNHLLNLKYSDIERIDGFSNFRNCIDASVFSEIYLKTKCLISLFSSIEKSSINVTRIVGAHGSIFIPHLQVFPNMTPCFLETHFGQDVNRISVPQVNAYDLMIKSFTESVRENTPCEITLEESRSNLSLILALQREVNRSKGNIHVPRVFFSFIERWRLGVKKLRASLGRL
jgi:D-xylose 1-dehydrogenase (NADP+, D-xylono-1,5-lactone-forming)